MFRRKHRRHDSQPNSDSPPDRRTSIPSSSTAFSVSRNTTKASSQSGKDGLSRGSLGLNLLHSGSDPQVDLIFVHGLGGDSRKTWCKNRNISSYWPQEWLPRDSAFGRVRVHSYGYDSDYRKGQDDCLNVHHIGKALLGELSTSPHLAGSETRIVVIGHSMGGLVIKKAYILAKQDGAYQTLADRFAAFYFLATPHSGADSAKLLRNILRVAHDRAYVADLGRNSSAIQVINDEFRHVSVGLELWSFYETQVMKHFSSTIVDAESAILGYREEKQIPLNADHRSICKFGSMSDPNYVLIRNALASTVLAISTPTSSSGEQVRRGELRTLREFLGVPETLEDDFLASKEERLNESCQWLSNKEEYMDWLDGSNRDHGVLWVNGKPAAGKSVLATHVVDDLQQSGRDCAHFFFKHGDKSKSRLSACLRSLAFQTGRLQKEVRKGLLAIAADEVRLDGMDDRTLWRMLFLDCILKHRRDQCFWVIDALDECSNHITFFTSILPHLGSIPLKILITSRDTVDLVQKFSLAPVGLVTSFSVTFSDTFTDLALLVERHSRLLPVINEDEKKVLTEDIITRSRGSFLWTILVLQELRHCHTKKERDTILDEVPREMESLYGRILVSMSQATRSKGLARAVLMWATYATRPLTVQELHGALQLELKDSFPRLEQSIRELCGQLVAVDRFGKVQMIHETAREFLIGSNVDSEFALSRRAAHTRIAVACLTYLSGNEMNPPRSGRRTLGSSSRRRSDFARYAIQSFTYHLVHADAAERDLLQLLDRFFKSNIATWTEAIAETRDLAQLVRASKHLAAYSDACAIEQSPLSPQIRSLRQWCADLNRLAAKFANALATIPSAIYSIIPPLCPTDSMIYRLGNQYQGPRVIGVLSKEWEDRVSFIDYRTGFPTTFCHSPDFLAVGLTTGIVKLYHGAFYQEYGTLQHGESVKLIRFKPRSHVMATCGVRSVKLWDARTGELLQITATIQKPLDMAFRGNMLLLAGQKNHLDAWDTDNEATWGSRVPWQDSAEIGSAPPRRCPCALTISVEHNMLAVAYTGKPIILWDLQENDFFGYCGKFLPNGEINPHLVTAMIFNPNTSLSLLAVSYLDGDLAIIDPFSNEQVECFRANCQMLAASRNGRFLAAGGSHGIINVYEFETLKVLYTVKSSNSFIKQINFSEDSLRIVDIRGTQCNIWEPAALLRESPSDDSSGFTSACVTDVISLEPKAKVTTIQVHPSSEFAFCGSDDGKVLLYCCKTAACLSYLCSHTSPIRHLIWCSLKQYLLSIDSSNHIFIYEVQKSAENTWTSNINAIFETHLVSDQVVISALIKGDGEKFVVSTRQSDYFFTVGHSTPDREIERDGPTVCKWTAHAESPVHLVRITSTDTRIYSWLDWSEVTQTVLPIDTNLLTLKSLIPLPFGSHRGVLLEFFEKHGSSATKCLMSVGTSEIPVLDDVADDSSQRDLLDPERVAHDVANIHVSVKGDVKLCSVAARVQMDISHVIGISAAGKLVFLDRRSWVSTVDLVGPANSYKRHFFIPNDWFAGERDIVCALSETGVIFARGGGVAIVKGCFINEFDTTVG